MPLLIPDIVREHLTYRPETGDLVWVKPTNSKGQAGRRAGYINSTTGYVVGIGIHGTQYQAHRVAWFLATGEQPGEIDHINRVKTDNRLQNLRDISHAENMRNRVAPLGRFPRGISARGKRFRASIWGEGQNRHIGVFDTVEEAVLARAKALAEAAIEMDPNVIKPKGKPNEH